MKTILSRTPAIEYRGEALVVGVFESETATSPRLRKIDALTNGLLTRAMSGKEFSGKMGQTLFLYDPQGLGVPLLLLIGIGSPDTVDRKRGLEIVEG
ncbi:M17 family peptidase N-terminal domain-containing protein, partial [Gemmatimonadota bacterium]